ncbi:tetratricopeptide repeat protein [Ornithinibacillus halophilus]|uniref:Tetratricopeptide repeat-containing protein n=1 Tax=Ornithinibacillus halophilus TaxID=930117 RepID=A0A1M5MMW7_9BACI|nr:tetratricopeptide repeat protein [Ornithinibacillus halophilus]SHG78123.1 Tetratricopeptide repeat-containing protein [Ornithinibacillus halophilus]
MSEINILNFEEKVQSVSNEANKKELLIIIDELKRKHYPNVLSKIEKLQQQHEVGEELSKTLSLMQAVSHAEIGEFKASRDIIYSLYENADSSKELLLLGELAYMSDYKLARRILSSAVKVSAEDSQNRITKARIYLILGETEEKLQKYKRAIKYFKNGLEYFNEQEKRDQYMIFYLHFKIGTLYATINEADDAIEFLSKTIELADEHQDSNIKIHSLISLAKTYADKEKSEKVIYYLKDALHLLGDSPLKGTYTHAEALTEMGYAYFTQSKYEQAIPYYEQATNLYWNLSNPPMRKLGMIYMQFSFCLENQTKQSTSIAGVHYEKAIDCLEKANDEELLENALADVISFFERTNNGRKKRLFENKFVNLTNQKTRNA